MRSTFRLLSAGPPAVLALTLCCATTVSALGDGDTHQMQRVKIVACEDGEVTDINADDLALGETREVVTSCGKVVSVTRTPEDEIRVAIDGEDMPIPGADLELHELDHDGDGAVRHKIIIRKGPGSDCEDHDDCEGHARVHKIVLGGDGDGDLDTDVMALISEELNLDCEEGDEECHAEIVRLLEENDGDGDHVVVIKKRIHRDDEDDEDDNE